MELIFTSIWFFIFLGIVFAVHLFLNHNWQNRWLLFASYVFYSSWGWQFSVLLLLSTVINFFCGKKIHASKSIKRKKLFLFAGISSSILILGIFKYYDFFVNNVSSFLHIFGLNPGIPLLNIALPIGISFYTFQKISYLVDIYKKKYVPKESFIDFALFASFFPQLVAGPIERASHLLPQIQSKRTVRSSEIFSGISLIFFGLFMKMFVADNLSEIVESVFSGAPISGIQVILALYAFSFQIFCDFAGYSTIAIGVAKFFGINLVTNFNLPYFSKTPKEFWKRWHISLSSWVMDYLYIPLGGNKYLLGFFPLLVSMLIIGLWHGAALTFIAWGFYWFCAVMLHRIYAHFITKKELFFTKWKLYSLFSVILMFNIASFSWLFFRAETIGKAIYFINLIIFSFGQITSNEYYTLLRILFFVGPLLIIQLLQYWKKEDYFISKQHFLVRGLIYSAMFYLFVIYGVTDGQEFIYFRF